MTGSPVGDAVVTAGGDALQVGTAGGDALQVGRPGGDCREAGSAAGAAVGGGGVGAVMKDRSPSDGVPM